jgi:hypothetical protein
MSEIMRDAIQPFTHTMQDYGTNIAIACEKRQEAQTGASQVVEGLTLALQGLQAVHTATATSHLAARYCGEALAVARGHLLDAGLIQSTRPEARAVESAMDHAESANGTFRSEATSVELTSEEILPVLQSLLEKARRISGWTAGTPEQSTDNAIQNVAPQSITAAEAWADSI